MRVFLLGAFLAVSVSWREDTASALGLDRRAVGVLLHRSSGLECCGPWYLYHYSVVQSAPCWTEGTHAALPGFTRVLWGAPGSWSEDQGPEAQREHTLGLHGGRNLPLHLAEASTAAVSLGLFLVVRVGGSQFLAPRDFGRKKGNLGWGDQGTLISLAFGCQGRPGGLLRYHLGPAHLLLTAWRTRSYN